MVSIERNATWLVVGAIASVLAGGLIGIASDVDLVSVAFPLVLATFLAAGCALIATYARRGEALSILPLVTGFYLLAFAVGALYFRYPREGGGSGALTGFQHTYTPDGLVLALLLALAGWSMLAAGYRFGTLATTARRIPRPRLHDGETMPVVVALLAAGWLARGWAFTHDLYYRYPSEGATTTRGQFDTIVQTLTNLPLLAFCLLLVLALRTRRWALVGACLVAELAWALPSGERSKLIALLLAAAVCRYYGSDRRFPWRGVALAAVVCVVVIFPFGALYRGTTGDADVYRASPVARIAETATTLLTQSPVTTFQSGYEETVSRFSDIASLAVITTQGRAAYPRDDGATLTDWAGSVVPRFLLPTKGNPGTIGNDFGLSYNILNYRATGRSSIAVTQLGDLYGAFGLLGMLVLAALLGVVYRALDEYFHDRRTNVLMLGIYATVLGRMLLGLETSIAVGVIGVALKAVAIYVVAVAVLLWFVRLVRPVPAAVSDTRA